MHWQYYFLLVITVPPYIESKLQPSLVKDKNKVAQPSNIVSKTQQSSERNRDDAKDNNLRNTNGLPSIIKSTVAQPSESKTKVKYRSIDRIQVDKNSAKEARYPPNESKVPVKRASVKNKNTDKGTRLPRKKIKSKLKNKGVAKLAKSKGQQSHNRSINKNKARFPLSGKKIKLKRPRAKNKTIVKRPYRPPKVQKTFLRQDNAPIGTGIRRQVNNNLRIRNENPFRLQDGKKNVVETIGGNVTNIENFPYMAAVIINGKLWCAGAIVDTNWVLTAAHCLNYVLHVTPLQTLSKYVKVRVGSSKAFEGGNLVDVVGAIRHPKYEQVPVPHADVALLKLAENLEFHKYVNQINIFEGTTEPYAQSFIEVSGWGVTKDSDSEYRDHARDMLTARLKVRPQQYCMDTYQLVDGFQFTDDFFCASLRNGTRDACLFDAGAPAVQNNQMMGLMSFGPEKCGHIFQPAVFIKAYYFRDFVEDTIERYRKPPKRAKNEHNAEVLEASEEPSRLDGSKEIVGPLNIMLLSLEEKNANKD